MIPHITLTDANGQTVKKYVSLSHLHGILDTAKNLQKRLDNMRDEITALMQAIESEA